jgi:hypothetical protein
VGWVQDAYTITFIRLLLSLPKQPTEFDDGLLTASEIAQLKLNADWVVLSACNTAAGDSPGAEALSGLARAFFYAGAWAQLVSHWAVDSKAATRLTTSTFDKSAATKRCGAPCSPISTTPPTQATPIPHIEPPSPSSAKEPQGEISKLVAKCDHSFCLAVWAVERFRTNRTVPIGLRIDGNFSEERIAQKMMAIQYQTWLAESVSKALTR